jgi:5-methylcytosine-specific restriction protein A
MPFKSPKECLNPNCHELTTKGAYCPAHTVEHKPYNKELDRSRGSACERGYDGKWRQARVGYLRKHPLCIECVTFGARTPATVVDHIVPHRGDKDLFWHSSNWQALCRRCHNKKTAKGL